MNTAEVAQALRRAMLDLPGVSTVHVPGLFSPGVYFLRAVQDDGHSFSIELRGEKGGDDE